MKLYVKFERVLLTSNRDGECQVWHVGVDSVTGAIALKAEKPALHPAV